MDPADRPTSVQLAAITVSDPTDTRGLLLRTAAAAVLEDGLATFDLDGIDRPANLPTGTCRRVFRSRGALVAAMLESHAAASREALDAVLARHPDDVVAALVDWIDHELGPGRERIRVLLALMLDAGIRREVRLYADALQLGWDRNAAGHLPLTGDQLGVAWPMVEGLIVLVVIRGGPMPDREALRSHVRALLRAGGG
jgi:AcrR family transcriptional regulator